MLDKNLKDLLDAGIGIIKLGEDNIKQVLSKLEKNFSELKEKGAQDNSEVAVQLRELLSRTLSDVKNVSDQAEKNLNKFLDDAKQNSQRVLGQFKQFVGEDNINDFSSKMEEIAKNIQKRPVNGHDSVSKSSGSTDSNQPGS